MHAGCNNEVEVNRTDEFRDTLCGASLRQEVWCIIDRINNFVAYF